VAFNPGSKGLCSSSAVAFNPVAVYRPEQHCRRYCCSSCQRPGQLAANQRSKYTAALAKGGSEEKQECQRAAVSLQDSSLFTDSFTERFFFETISLRSRAVEPAAANAALWHSCFSSWCGLLSALWALWPAFPRSAPKLGRGTCLASLLSALPAALLPACLPVWVKGSLPFPLLSCLPAFPFG
jgi:hypothetical protein